MTTSSTTQTQLIPGANRSLTASLDVIEVKPGLKFSRAVLQDLLPDVKTALFFGKVYELDYVQLSALLATVLHSDVASALFNEGDAHSTELQDYLVDIADQLYGVNAGDLAFDPDVPTGEILPELWKSLELEIADSIKAVAEKLQSVVHAMPGKQGQMVFRSMSVMNAKRPTIGDYRAKIHHAPQAENLVILDCSGSVTAPTIRKIVDDVVALSYNANAHLAVVSDTCTYWQPGSYGTDQVLAAAEFGGTHYETLAPLFDRDWGVVVTIADYDSSPDAKAALKQCVGHIDEVLDISLVNRPTYLAQCVGQMADSVRPLLVASTQSVLGSGRDW